jgi:HAD superfamily hydrolase (TIGR01484 family)
METIDFDPKLAIFDLDGTLTESKQQLERDMGELLNRLMNKMPVGVMSGASFKQFQKQFFPGLPEGVPPDRLYIFPTNAAQCYVHKNGNWEVEYTYSLSAEEKTQISEAIERALKETGFDAMPEKVWGERIEDRDAQIAFSFLGQDAPLEAKSAWDPDRNKRLQIRSALQPMLSDFSISIGGKNTIDFTRKGVTKSFGLRALSRITQVDIKDMVYVGDALDEGGNDEVVKETGIRTFQVAGPADTREFINAVVSK